MQGGKIVRPADPQRNGYRFEGWYADDMMSVPWDFEEDTVDASLTLYAKWTMLQGVFMESLQVTPNNTLVDLSGYEDWLHFGDESHDVIHCDRKNLREKDRAFGQLVNIDNQREENELNRDQPFAFTWTGGTPVAAAVEPNRYFSWTRNGMELPVTVPAGFYACELYLSGIRSRGTVEVPREDGSIAVEARQLWANTKESRQYRTLSLQFNNIQPQTYTIRLLVDLTDTERENYSMAIATATLRRSMFEAQVKAGEHGQASLRGGEVHKAGKNVKATARPEDGYQFAGWEVVQGDLTLERSMQNPLIFEMPSDDIVLKAVFAKHVVSVKELEPVAQRSVINLSDAGNMDWAYLGRGDGVVRKADVTDSAFTSAVTALDGQLKGENMAHTNPDTPGFDWSGGAPLETGSNVREILWSADGLQFDIRLPQGRYETVLYLSGVRAGVIAEVLDQRGSLLMDTKLWDCMQDYRPYRRLTLSMDCETAQRFTVRLRVDTSDTHADWYSVSLYAAAVQDRSASARPGCVYDLNADTGIVSGIQAGTTAAQLTAGFGGGEWVVVRKDGQEVTEGLAGTGMTVQYKDGGQESYTAAVTGGLDGDGKTSITDVMEACKVLARTAAGTQPTALELAAGDLDGQAGMTISDVMESKILARMA
ncbi:MAG: InlB B-repeat-containing protein [Clostridiales bacterium]|nr:InlB B-repeat-containing protein [Clostridiales bacterium]